MAAFENIQRMGKLLCSSSIVPQSYRDNLADTVIALEMANRMGANPLAVMQSLVVVYGKPTWYAQFVISCVNCCGKFTPLRYRMTGERGQDSWGCIAWAKDATGEVLESPEVTIAIAKAEGWYGRNGSKWKTMPELMLRYRAATWFARTFAPDLTMGMRTQDEAIDIESVVEASEKPALSFTRKEEQAQVPATTEAPPPKEPRKAKAKEEPKPEKTPTAQIEEILAGANVFFDDFRGWLVSAGHYAQADSIATVDDLPATVKAALLADGAETLEKCCKLFGNR